MTISLYKKTGTCFSKEKNKDVPFTNFYVKCNEKLIPVEIKYFPNPQFENRDPGYQGRFAVLAFIITKMCQLVWDKLHTKDKRK
jgi:hypothetical protein